MIQDTSLEAHEEVKKTLSDRQERVLHLLRMAGIPLTNSEIAQALRWSINRITPRVFELRELRLVTDSGKRRCRITGRNAYGWRPTTVEERKTGQLSLPLR